jgi:hypothetical protein
MRLLMNSAIEYPCNARFARSETLSTLPANSPWIPPTSTISPKLSQTFPGLASLDALAAALKEAIPEPLPRALAGSRQRNPRRFEEDFRTEQVLGVTPAGVENGRPSLVDLGFRMNDTAAEDVRLTIEEHHRPGAGCPTGLATILVGPQHLQERFENLYPNFWIGNPDDLAKNAEAFVQMAIDADLADVATTYSSSCDQAERLQMAVRVSH